MLRSDDGRTDTKQKVIKNDLKIYSHNILKLLGMEQNLRFLILKVTLLLSSLLTSSPLFDPQYPTPAPLRGICVWFPWRTEMWKILPHMHDRHYCHYITSMCNNNSRDQKPLRCAWMIAQLHKSDGEGSYTMNTTCWVKCLSFKNSGVFILKKN